MAMGIPWEMLCGADLGKVDKDNDRAGRVQVDLEDRSQRVEIEILEPEQGSAHPAFPFPVVRLTSVIMDRSRALSALVLRGPGNANPGPEPEQRNRAHRLLALLAHNDRLRGVHLNLTKSELRATADLVCLHGVIDEALLVARIRRLARVADGMEQRVTGQDVW